MLYSSRNIAGLLDLRQLDEACLRVNLASTNALSLDEAPSKRAALSILRLPALPIRLRRRFSETDRSFAQLRRSELEHMRPMTVLKKKGRASSATVFEVHAEMGGLMLTGPVSTLALRIKLIERLFLSFISLSFTCLATTPFADSHHSTTHLTGLTP